MKKDTPKLKYEGKDYTIFAHYISRSESLEDAIEKCELHQKEKNKKIDLWGNKYDSIPEIGKAFGIDYGNINYYISQGKTLEEAVTTVLNRSFIEFKNRTYKDFTELCTEYNMILSTVLNRLTYGMSLEEALLRPIRKNSRTNLQIFRGIAYQNKMEICRQWGVSDTLVALLIRYDKTKKMNFTKAIETLVRFKEVLKISKKKYLFIFLMPIFKEDIIEVNRICVSK